MNEALEYLTSLFGKLVDTLDNLQVVQGVSILSVLLGVIIIMAVLNNTFGGSEK